MKKGIISSLLIMALLVSVMPLSANAANSLINFSKVNTYVSGQYTDVSTTDWFAPNVAAAYELGLMKGTSDTYFNAKGNITIAETIVLACRLHSIYYADGYAFVQGDPWYRVYVDYAFEKGIVSTAYPDYAKPATRAEFASILVMALPDEALELINTVQYDAIPDVPSDQSYAEAVYKLYRAGIVVGNDSSGTFTPNSNIGRSAVAAIVTRMADESLRKTITLKIQGYNQDIEITGATLTYDEYGTPLLYLDYTNNLNKDIVRFDFYILCYDVYGDLVAPENYAYTMEKLLANGTGTSYWELYGYEGVQLVVFGVYRYAASDGTIVNIPDNQIMWWQTSY